MNENYKLTKLGDIPQSWDVKKLGELLNIQTGNKNAQDASTDGLYMFFTRSITTQRINSYSFDTEALFIAGEGNFLVKYFYGKFDVHQRTYILTAINENVCLPFFKELIQSKIEKLVSTSVGSTVQSLRKPIIYDLLLPVPSELEQRKIANILSTVDKKIELVGVKINQTQELKKGLIQQLLTKGIGHTQFKSSELGDIPENWELVTVKDITVDHKQGYYTKESYSNEGVKLVRITDLQNPKVDFSEMPRLIMSDKDFESYKIIAGDFLFARSGAIGRYGIVENVEHPAVFASYLIRFRFANQIINRFFGYFYESLICSKQLKGIAQGNVNININAENIKSLKLPLPPLSEQIQIVSIVNSVDEKLELLALKKKEFEKLKAGLMQQLLTGKLRVNLYQEESAVA